MDQTTKKKAEETDQQPNDAFVPKEKPLPVKTPRESPPDPQAVDPDSRKPTVGMRVPQ